MKKFTLFAIAFAMSLPCFALEKNTERSLCFGNKYKIQLEDGASLGFAYSDKSFFTGEDRRFAQKWGVGMDFRVSNDSRFGLRLGFDDAGKSQRDAVGVVWGKTF